MRRLIWYPTGSRGSVHGCRRLRSGCVYVSMVVVGEWTGPWDAPTRGSSRSPEPCVQANMMSQTMWFPKIQCCAPPSSPHRPSVPAYTNTQQRHSKTAQLTLRVCCWLWPLPGSVGFTGSFTPPCHAWPHQRPWTLTLCAATEARGKNLLAHNTGISSACVSACVCARVHAY